MSSVKKTILVSIVVGQLLAGCQSVNTTNAGAVGIERKQYMFSMLSSQEVDQMYAQSYQQTLGEANRVDFEKYQHIKTGLLPRAIDCQKLSAATGVNVSPEWNAQAEECIKTFESVVRDSIKTYFWTQGSQVFIEWKISNNKKSFALSQFGGDGLPNLTFNDFLKALISNGSSGFSVGS